MDLNSLTEATLNEVMRLQLDAKRLMERASALGADHAKLIGNFSALNMENKAFTITPPVHQLVPESESAVAQIAAIAAVVSSSTPHQQQPAFTSDVARHPTETSSQEPEVVPVGEPALKKKQRKKSAKTQVDQHSVDSLKSDACLSPEPAVSTSPTDFPPAVVPSEPNVSSSPVETERFSRPEELAQPTLPVIPEIPTTPSGKMSKRQKKKVKSASEDLEKSVEQEPVSIVAEDADWDIISDPVFDSHYTNQPPYLPQQQQTPEPSSVKKSKKKKKGK